MRRKPTEEIFGDELKQVASFEGVDEEKEWQKELVRKHAGEMEETAPPLTLEQAMQAIKDYVVAGELREEDYTRVTDRLVEEKDKVSLSQWITNEGVKLIPIHPESPKPKEEQKKDKVLEETVREPLEREGARYKGTLPKAILQMRKGPDWLKNFTKDGDVMGDITYLGENRSGNKFFQHKDYPNYVVSIDTIKAGWMVFDISEEKGEGKDVVISGNEYITEDEIGEPLIIDLLHSAVEKAEGTSEKEEFGMSDETLRDMIAAVYVGRFNWTKEKAAEQAANFPKDKMRQFIELYYPGFRVR